MTMHLIRRTLKRRQKQSTAASLKRSTAVRRLAGMERLEDRVLLAADFQTFSAFRNPILQFDVNNDGRTTAVDAVIVINDLNQNGPRQLATGNGGGVIGDDGGLAAAGENPQFFVDTNGDGRLTALDVLGVFNKLNAQQGEQVQVRLEVTDLNGNPVETLAPGQEFQLRGFIKDLREPQNDPVRGVFSFYADVLFNPAQAAVDLDMRSITYGQLFPNGQRLPNQITATAGKLDDIGAFSNSSPYGSQEVLLFVVPMQAQTGVTGVTSFMVEDDMSDLFDVSLYGGNQAVPPTEILFVGDQVTIGDQPAASIADVSVAEGNAQSTATVTVTLSSPAIVATTINFATMDDTGANPATAGQDYTATSGALTFDVGATEATIQIPILGDLVQEPDETFRVVLSSPSGATIADGEAVVTIQNDDSPPVITIANTTVVEPVTGTTNAAFVVTLSTPVNETVTVDYATVNGTAITPDDYLETGGTLTFAPGVTSQTILVTVNSDVQTEASEDFSVVLANPNGAGFPDNAQTQMATGTIVDAAASRVVLRLEARNAQGEVQTIFEPGDEIHIRGYVTDATADDEDNQDGVFQMFHDLVYDTSLVDIAGGIAFGPDYPNQRTGDLSMEGLIDELGATADLSPIGAGEHLLWEIAFTAQADGVARFTTNPADLPEHETLIYGEDEAVNFNEIQYGTVDVLIGAGPTISIADSQVTEGNSGTTPMVFDISLSSPHLVPVTVNYTTSDGTATSPGDYQPASGQVTFAPGETVKMISVNVVGDTELESAETFFVTLSNSVNAEIAEGRERGIGTILDDEVRTLSINNRAIAEGGFGMFTVSLSSPAGTPISVNFATTDGTATAGVDYLPASGTLTFGPGEQTQTITVQTLLDNVSDDAETFLVQLSSPVGAEIAVGTGVGTISEVPLAGLSGVVYVDTNRDDRRTQGEMGIAGVTIELYGTAVLPSGETQTLQLTTQTDANGVYVFENLLSGSYSIHEVQPAAFNDGGDTAGAGGLVTANDWMFVNFTEGGTASGFNFGEAGVRLEFVGKRVFLASAINGGSTNVDLSNGDVFFSFDGGFSSLSLQATSNTAQPATITLLDNNLNVVARSAPSQLAALSAAGYVGQPYFVRIGGGSASVQIDSFVMGGPNASGQPVDDVFASIDEWLN
jgi:hypothetical protein